MKKVRVAVIGGSNTVMNAGYLTHIAGCARIHGLDVQIFANLSIGNTSSSTGLMQLKANDILGQTDLLLIEYALNDAALYGEDRASVTSWTKAYEGIIRYARTVNPAIRILSSVFYNQVGSHRTSLPIIPAAISYLTDWYGLDKVDLHQEFTRRFGPTYPDAVGLYQDQAHYSRPVSVRLVGEVVAEALVASARRPDPYPVLPAPVDAANYAKSRVVAGGTWNGLTQENYKNSVYSVEAVDLASGDVTIRIEGGKLLAALFVCVPAVSRLYVTLEGKTYELPTLRPSIRDGKFRFLLATMNFEVLSAPRGPEAVYRLSLERPTDIAPTVARQEGSVPHVGGDELHFPLVRLMYTGAFRGYEVAPRNAEKLLAAE